MDHHESVKEPHEIKQSSDRSFGLTFFVVFLIIALWPLLWGNSVRLLSLGAAIIFLAMALTMPKGLSPLNRIWLKFGALLHALTSPIILGLMFYMVIMPIGLIMRLLGKDLLRLRSDPNTDSYWIKREPPGPEKNTLHRQF